MDRGRALAIPTSGRSCPPPTPPSRQTFGRAWAGEGKDPAAAFDNAFAIEAAPEQAGATRAAVVDANHFLYLAKANQLFIAGHGDSLADALARIEAPTPIIHQP